MILQVMVCFDKKARAFMVPFFVAHTDMGIRAMAGAVETGEGGIRTHPEDFALYYLGSYDDEKGRFDLAPQPMHCVEAVALKKAEASDV